MLLLKCLEQNYSCNVLDADDISMSLVFFKLLPLKMKVIKLFAKILILRYATSILVGHL